MKIILSGGGTMGSVSPLIAVYEQIKEKDLASDFLFIGTTTGPERAVVGSYKIPFRAISSGKFRRYFSFDNFLDLFKIFFGFWQSFFIIKKFQPAAVMVAGSFVGVPVAWAAWVLRVPVLVQHLDIVPGLANKLVAGMAKAVTVAFEPSLNNFPAGKTFLTGNPVRTEIMSCQPEKSRQFFGLKNNLPVLLVMGGGIGSQAINNLLEQSLADLLQFCQIIHITGQGKKINAVAENYYQFEFLAHEMPEALCAADVVVSRAGLSALAELSILGKPAIIIPIPGSQQEANAQFFQKNNAIVTLSQNSLTKEILVDAVRELTADKALKENLSRNISKMMKRDGAVQVAKLLLEIAR